MPHEEENTGAFLLAKASTDQTQNTLFLVFRQLTIYPTAWDRHEGLWLHVSPSEAALSKMQRVIELDIRKKRAFGCQIKVTLQ